MKVVDGFYRIMQFIKHTRYSNPDAVIHLKNNDDLMRIIPSINHCQILAEKLRTNAMMKKFMSTSAGEQYLSFGKLPTNQYWLKRAEIGYDIVGEELL